MRTLKEVFDIWSSVRELADDLGIEYDTVLRWRLRGRIPEDSWDAVIHKAARRGILVTVNDLLSLNKPIGLRGRPRKDRSVATSA